MDFDGESNVFAEVEPVLLVHSTSCLYLLGRNLGVGVLVCIFVCVCVCVCVCLHVVDVHILCVYIAQESVAELVVHLSRKREARCLLRKGVNHLGRSNNNHVFIPEHTVSSRHASLGTNPF